MVNEMMIENFERDGFVVLPGVLPRETISRLVDVGDKWINTDGVPQRQVMDAQTDSIRNCISLDDAFVELLAHPKVLPYMVRLLGPDIKLLTSHLIYRERADEGADPLTRKPGWHRDFAQAQRSLGYAAMPRLDIKAAFCLSDLPTTGCGGTLFVPGSHLRQEKIGVAKNEDPTGAVEPVVKAGDCILFENRTWHAGSVNTHGDTRKVAMIGYTYVWIQPSDYKRQSPDTLHEAERLYGNIGLQLLGGLPEPDNFDYDYDSKPLRDWVQRATAGDA